MWHMKLISFIDRQKRKGEQTALQLCQRHISSRMSQKCNFSSYTTAKSKSSCLSLCLYHSDFRTFCGREKHLWTVWRCTAPVTSICQRSPWSLALTPHCGRTTPWQTLLPTSPCSSPTPNSWRQWANSGKPVACMQSAFPQGSSWSA